MIALAPTDFTAEITWLGFVPHRERAEIETRPLTEMALGFGGFAEDCHSGETRPSCSRVVAQHPKGTEIANVRQLSVVSEEEMAQIAAEIGVERLKPEWLGASVVVSGIPDFSNLTPSARLQGPDGATLVIDMQNLPCQFPAKTMKPEAPEAAKRFKAAAEGVRGVTAWVERPGCLRLGDALRLHLPTQREWRPGL
ncbi:MOSC domain-containing protein [Poseidonocella sedimentorum]|uniref:MOSC domain-containing protein n=1 Tax=Poseidonocella sedimentorum TaxID=871652 RepID=A0A1I6E9Q9_9RHOB|nr:MOSC domain-containing protein [Poseidonocella sedimentorum]SFR14377.1 MOSC domain-containing protein [Poseidonocella sedimentorum]